MLRITEDDVAQWLAHQKEAEGLLPQLMRLLITSLVQRGDILEINFPGGKGVHAPGIDGLLVARNPCIFASTLRSAWEISIEADVKGKANSDYQKRKKTADKETTYIALSGRLWAGKQAWAAERRTDGLWADVRTYDAVDLATWLGQTVSVTMWLAQRMGRPLHGLITGGLFLQNWASRTNPPLMIDALFAGREAESAMLKEYAQKGPRLVRILSETRDEAVAFAVGAAGERGDDAVVVMSESAWNDLIPVMAEDRCDTLIIPAFAGYDGSAFLSSRHHLVIPIEPGQETESAPEIKLPPVRRDSLAQALKAAGVEPERSKQIADMSGGKLSAVQRMLGYVLKRPEWCRSINPRILTGMLVAGAWVPASESDRKVLCDLCNASWDEVEAATTQMLSCPDAPLRRHGEVIRFRSTKDAWALLGPSLGGRIVEAYLLVCKECLCLPDPRYDLPAEERVYASIKGKTLPHSPALRTGLCATACWMVLHDQQINPSIAPYTAKGIAVRVVRELLSRDWRTWTSLGSGLRSLAEASPDVFLEEVRLAVRNRADEVAPIFAQESTPFFGGFEQAQLLWAIESLAWNPDLFTRTALLLVELSGIDKGVASGNRPFGSLISLFTPHLKVSTIEAGDRQRALANLVRHNAGIGWRLLCGIADGFMHGYCGMDNARPRFISWSIPPPFSHYEQAEIQEYLRFVKDLYEGFLDAEPRRLLDAVDVRHVGFIGLRKVAEKIRQHKYVLLADSDMARQLRAKIREYFRFPDSRDQEALAIAKELLVELEPQDVAEKHAWLFEQHPPLSDYPDTKWDARHAEVLRLRAQIVKGVASYPDFEKTMVRIASISGCPGNVGASLASDDNWRDYIPFMGRMEWGAEEGDLQIAKSYWAEAVWKHGVGVFRDHVHSMLPDIGLEAAGRLIAGIPSSPEVRDWIEGETEIFQKAYWDSVCLSIWSFRDDDDFARTIRRLLEAGRWWIALDSAHHVLYSGKIGKRDDFLAILRHGRHATKDEVTKARQDSLFSWTIGELFEKIGSQDGVDRQEIAMLELFYLRVLEHSKRGLREIPRELNTNPQFFVEVLTMIYRGEDERPPAEAENNVSTGRFETAMYILHGWSSFPGEGSPAAERDEKLRSWCDEVMQLCRKAKRQKVGDINVGEVLSRVPPAEIDGIWPSVVARELIEEGSAELARGVMQGKINSRGVTTRGPEEGGQQERELAAKCRADATTLKVDYPLTARMLEQLALDYGHDARRHDVEAEEFTDPWL